MGPEPHQVQWQVGPQKGSHPIPLTWIWMQYLCSMPFMIVTINILKFNSALALLVSVQNKVIIVTTWLYVKSLSEQAFISESAKSDFQFFASLQNLDLKPVCNDPKEFLHFLITLIK